MSDRRAAWRATVTVPWFRPYVPSPDVNDVLDCRYVAASAGRHDLIPDGSMDLVWNEDADPLLCGPDTRAWGFDMAVGTRMAGVRFRPGAAAAVFGVDAVTLVDRRVPLADLLGGRPARELSERLAEADDVTRLSLLEDLVRRRVGGADIDPTVELAAMIADAPYGGVAGLAERRGVSARQLRRWFDRSVGYGPGFFARIARLQRFAKGAARWPDRGLAELAAAAGYVDQSHLAKDARAITGRTPRELTTVLGRSSLAVDVRSVQDASGRSPSRWAA